MGGYPWLGIILGPFLGISINQPVEWDGNGTYIKLFSWLIYYKQLIYIYNPFQNHLVEFPTHPSIQHLRFATSCDKRMPLRLSVCESEESVVLTIALESF